MSLFASILALSFIIFFHELGHFLAARVFCVKVLVFSLGFGKKIFSFNAAGTTYQLSLIPLGGYVKLKGEEDSKDFVESNNFTESKKDSLKEKHPLARIIIFLSGPLFNIILAFLIYFVLYFSQGLKVNSNEPIINFVSKDYPSFHILKQYDKIITINGMQVKKFEDISKILNADSINLDSNKKVANIIILRPKNIESFHKYITTNCDIIDIAKCYENYKDFQILELNVPLSYAKDSITESKNTKSKEDSKSQIKNKNRVIIGIAPLFYMQKLSFIESISKAQDSTLDSAFLIYDGLKKLIIGAIGLDNISGVIGMTDISSKAFENSFITFCLFIALISINLGVINLLPLPLLDGGQILFTLYEWIFRREISPKVANLLIIFGISFIICIMLLGAFNDINRILKQA